MLQGRNVLTGRELTAIVVGKTRKTLIFSELNRICEIPVTLSQLESLLQLGSLTLQGVSGPAVWKFEFTCDACDSIESFMQDVREIEEFIDELLDDPMLGVDELPDIGIMSH